MSWAKAAAEFYARTFPGRYYLEVQNHGIPGQAEVNAGVFRLADDGPDAPTVVGRARV